MACAGRAPPWAGEAQEGCARLEVAVPSRPDEGRRGTERAMAVVVIGMDQHKRSATIEVMDAGEAVLGGGRYGTDGPGYRAMVPFAKRFPQRTWAIEGCAGVGKHIAHRLIADGEQVVDVPPKLSA